MNKQKRDDVIDLILCYMNDYVESQGICVGNAVFNFSDNLPLLFENEIELSDFQQALNTCISRGYVDGNTSYKFLRLTEEGQGRAISVESAKSKQSVGSSIQIGVLHNHGNAQFGDYNTQNVELVFNSIIEQINNSSASDEDKQEAKNLLQKFIAHPLTNSVLGAVTTLISAKLGGV